MVLLESMAASLVRCHSPSAIQLTLVEAKRVTFGGLRAALEAHLARPMRFDAEEWVTLGIGAVLVGEPEADLPPRDRRRLPLVYEAQG